MAVGTPLHFVLFILMVVVVSSLPENDHELGVRGCGNKTCDVNEFCDEDKGVCLDCAIQDCQGNNGLSNTDATSELDQTTMATKISTGNNGLSNTDATSELGQTPMATEISTGNNGLSNNETTSELGQTPMATEISETRWPSTSHQIDNKTKKPEREKKGDNLPATLALCGGILVICVGAYIYVCHPLGCRSQRIMRERDEMAGIYSKGIYQKENDEPMAKVPLQYTMQTDAYTKSTV
nr:uncharacterized protein LOC129270576 [Lytechinus pictus]